MALFPSQNCLIKTVTLQPGEPYNLPPGAELISATNINALTSTCPIPSTIEQPEDWVLVIAGSENEDTNDYYGRPRFGIGGYELGGVYTEFPSYYQTGGNPDTELANEGCFDMNAVATGLLTIPGVYAVNVSNGIEKYDGNQDNGCKCAWTMKIVPSVAASLYIVMGNSADLNNSTSTEVRQYHRLVTYADAIDPTKLNYGWIPTPPTL